MQPIYVSKSLSAASSNGLGSVSTAATSVVTVNSSLLDTGRRLVFYSTGDASSLTLTFTGNGESRSGTFSEAVVGSTAAGIAATTLSDFTQLTAVSISSNANIPILIGTSSVGGTPWKLVDWTRNPVALSAALTFSTSANGMTASIDITLDDVTGISQTPNFAVPRPFNSTSHVVAASTTSWGIVNIDANNITPVAGWRLTITSSATGAGSIAATVLQSG